MRTRGTCACGHVAALPGRADGRPACQRCAGITLNIGCVGCDAVDEPPTWDSLCWRRTLNNTVDRLLTNPEPGTIAEPLVPPAAAFRSRNEPTAA